MFKEGRRLSNALGKTVLRRFPTSHIEERLLGDEKRTYSKIPQFVHELGAESNYLRLTQSYRVVGDRAKVWTVQGNFTLIRWNLRIEIRQPFFPIGLKNPAAFFPQDIGMVDNSFKPKLLLPIIRKFAFSQ